MSLPEHLEVIRARVSNWGRWGDDDEAGTANLIDAAATRRGAAAVIDGRRISLALDLGPGGPQIGQPPRRINPLLTLTSLNERDPHAPGMYAASDDLVMLSTCAGTHIDALSHVTYDGAMYNGFGADEITASAGAGRCGADKLTPVATRAVLLDLPALLGVAGLDEIDPGYAITGDDLDAAAERARVEVIAGDVVLVRTGEMRHLHAGDRRRYALGDGYRFPGLSTESIDWLSERDVAGVFSDTYAGEAFPPPSPDWSDCLAVHMVHIRDMGLLQGQNWDLEALAADCAADGHHEMLLVAAPEPLVGATSAPVAPVAVK